MTLTSGIRKKLEYAAVALAVGAAPMFLADTFARYPYLQNVGKDRATILWTTFEEGYGEVEYSTDRSFASSVPASVRAFLPQETLLPFPYYQYRADLAGLLAGGEYYYRVKLDGKELPLPFPPLARFRTASSTPFRFLVIGDSGIGSDEQRRIAERMAEEDPALVLHTGDVVYLTGDWREQQPFYFDIYWRLMLRTAFYPTLGNHDVDTAGGAPYLAVHALPSEGVAFEDRGRYYSFDWGNVHFVSLDSNRSLVEAAAGAGKMLEWLDGDLGRNRSFWRVVFFHHPPYASGIKGLDAGMALARAHIAPILDRHRVPLVLNGHEHSYQRSWPIRGGQPVDAGQGTLYLVTGGGGAALYPVFPHHTIAFGASVHHYMRADVNGCRMTLRAIRVDGQEIDRVTLSPAPVISQDGVVNAASFTGALAPGALVSIFGWHLAAEEKSAASLPLPAEMAGVSVTFEGRAAPLQYVSGGQVNAQIPFDVEGAAAVRIATPNGWAESRVTVSAAAPAIFSLPGEGGPRPAVAHSDGSLVSAASPAAPGEHISIYLTGLGQVESGMRAGQAAPGAPPVSARTPVRVRFAGTPVAASFAGLAPGYAGLYQVNVRVPFDLRGGAQPLQIVAGEAASNLVTLYVR